MGDRPKAIIEFVPRSYRQQTPWDEADDLLWLLTPEELALCPAGTVLSCIDGSTAIVGTDRIDDDTRFGLLAYGLHTSQMPPLPAVLHPERESDGG